MKRKWVKEVSLVLDAKFTIAHVYTVLSRSPDT